MFGRGFWLLLCACVLLWQVGQGIVTGIFGIPGVIEFPFDAISGDSAANRKGGVSVVRKTGQPEAHARVQAPESDEMCRWIRAEAREFVGGMDDDGNMLYRFDVWLVVPEEAKGRIASVDYAFDAPSAKPPKRSSQDGKTGYRVSFGGLTCATSIEVKVTFSDGDARTAKVNGCQVLN